jgi:hypothetical protein
MSEENAQPRDYEPDDPPILHYGRPTTANASFSFAVTPVACGAFLVIGLNWLQPRWCSENHVWYVAFVLAIAGAVLGVWRRDRRAIVGSIVAIVLMLVIALCFSVLNRAR